jgi:hypothetical protein
MHKRIVSTRAAGCPRSKFSDLGRIAPPNLPLQKITLRGRTLGEKRKGNEIPSAGEAMRNITVTIPDDSYRRARVWAAQRDTSISAVVKYLLETMPGISRANSAFPANKPNSANTTNPANTANSTSAG